MDQSGGGSMPPSGQQPPPPPPPQGWQSTPTPPGPPPGGSGFGMGSSTMPPGPIAGTTIADFMTRLVAFIIDSIILGLINFLLNTVLFSALILSVGGLYVVIYAVLIVVINAAYFIYFWTTRKQTPGMMAMKLMIVQDGTGAALTQSQAIRRWMFLGLPLALTALIYAGGGLSFGVGAFVSLGILFTLATIVAIVSIGWEIYLAYTTSQDARKQGVHDKAVNSVVIATGPSPFAGNR
jgi:uncharacterized RDD family membrane protein YckC